MNNTKGYEMTVKVTARTAVYGEEAEYWAGLTDVQRGMMMGEVKAEVRRYFTEELDGGSEQLDINVEVTEVETEVSE
ncbi:hypothetical protein M6D81_11490 [Paenibacillus sp. J5C_2022]|uniref:hypothetical protein n=1 Tax=Paenibacillus sp. J5C2022 TaxID=2977129 RepID=UPI0021D19D9E|nr:hypothetical protein [Paenibacillus sp. J5C2022]MCU6709330.1 hypothetical protein [Paenibacillus sp. J5C2022]